MPIAWKCWIINLLQPSGPVQACTGIALKYKWHIIADGICQTSTWSSLTFKHLSHCGTSSQKKSVSSVCRQEATACFMSASVANHLDLFSQLDLWLVKVLWLECHGSPSLQSRCHAQSFHLFGHIKKHLTSTWSAINVYTRQAVTSWLQILGSDLFYATVQALIPQLL